MSTKTMEEMYAELVRDLRDSGEKLTATQAEYAIAYVVAGSDIKPEKAFVLAYLIVDMVCASIEVGDDPQVFRQACAKIAAEATRAREAKS